MMMISKLKKFDKRDDHIYYLSKLESKFDRAYNELNCEMAAARLGFSDELVGEITQAKKSILKLQYAVFEKMTELAKEQNNDTQKSLELSPCPFCGEDDIKIAVHKWNNDPKEDDFYSVACCNTDCGRPCKSGFPTRQEAVNSWNTRHTEQDDAWKDRVLNAYVAQLTPYAPNDSLTASFERVLIHLGMESWDLADIKEYWIKKKESQNEK